LALGGIDAAYMWVWLDLLLGLHVQFTGVPTAKSVLRVGRLRPLSITVLLGPRECACQMTSHSVQQL